MFIHKVLFKIDPSHVKNYINDCRMWAKQAKKAKGFVMYHTLKRTNEKNQYASVYYWKNKIAHNRFMGEFHDELVKRSKAVVEVLGYFNYEVKDLVEQNA